MPVCRQCKSGPTIKAHIIPAAFIIEARGTDNDFAHVSSRGARPTKSGIWDPNILCHPCDNRLSVFDNYAVTLFRRLENEVPEQHAPFEVNGIEVAKLLRFSIAVLWRASISERPEVAHVRLGPYEELFRQILYGNVPVPPTLETLLFRYYNPTFPTHQISRQPVRRKYNGSYYYDFIVCGWNFITKVGRAPLSPEMQSFALQQSNTNIVSANFPFYGTKDYWALKQLVDLARQQKVQRKPRSLAST